MTTDSKELSLLERLGGKDALEAAVEELYFRLLCDEKLLPFFDGVSLPLLKLHQKRFMTLAFTNIPEGVDPVALLSKAHSKQFEQGLNGTHFDLVATHLVEVLQSLGVSQELIDEVVSVVGPLRAVFEKNAAPKKVSGNLARKDSEGTTATDSLSKEGKAKKDNGGKCTKESLPESARGRNRRFQPFRRIFQNRRDRR